MYALKHLGCKFIISGNKIEFYDYQKPINIDFQRAHTPVKNENNDKRMDNVLRARQAVRQLIWSNICPHSKFLTLTCKDTCLDKKQMQRRFTTFIQAMKRNGYKLRYLYIYEHQRKRGLSEGNEGCWHLHLIIFNDEYIPYDIINRCWKWGHTDIHMLNGLKSETGEKVRDAGAYICKYITKDIADNFGVHCYECSQGLERPKEVNFYVYGYVDDKGIQRYGMTEADKNTLAVIAQNYKLIYEGNTPLEFTKNDGSIVSNYLNYQQGEIIDITQLNKILDLKELYDESSV